MAQDDEVAPARGLLRGRFRVRLFLSLIAAIVIFGLIIGWFSRISIADDLIQSQLAAMNVDADYEIEDVGFSKQVIRNLVIGDPENPDLVAELVEVGNNLTASGPGINWVRAKGVKLYGRLENGRLSFGELDKFTDPDDDSPLALPEIWLTLEEGQAQIDTDYGMIGVSLSGDGHLHHSFKGELAAISKQLKFGDCVFGGPSYFGEIAISSRKPTLEGPLRLSQMRCGALGLAGEDLAAEIDVTLGENFTDWKGDVGLVGGPIRYVSYAAQEIKASFDFIGDTQAMAGDVQLEASGLGSSFGRANVGRFNGSVDLGYGGQAMTARIDGEPSVESARLTPAMLGQMRDFASAANGTPIGPIAAKLAKAVNAAGRDFDMTSDLRFQSGGKATTLSIDQFAANAASGVRVTSGAPMLLSFTGNNIRLLADGGVDLSGGGFPDTQLVLNDGSLTRGFSGALQIANYQAGSARLAIPQLRFTPSRRGGTNIDGLVRLTGPIADGMVTGLQVPISGALNAGGGFSLFRECVDLQFVSLRAAAFVAGPTKTRLCPQNSGGIISTGRSGVNIAAKAPSLTLAGRLGDSPLRVNSGDFLFSMARGLTANDVSVQLGQADSLTRFDMAQITAYFGKTINGNIAGASGKIANVPLLMEDVEGDWRYVDGAFLADAALRVRDEQQVERFRPLISENVKLTFADGAIAASGLLREPTTSRQVAQVTIDHLLSNNSGEALITVDDLRFDNVLQPEMLTPLTLGVIANVEGVVTGAGQINWDADSDSIESTGTFRTNSVNLAAAFGPVTGLSGEITFSDLLALETGPGQQVRLSEINPGVAVFNGILNYRLLPDFRMQVEGGQWPFAGGQLYLEPTILDLSEEAERRLQFTVEGVDAAQFLTQFDFENLTATGIFDGRLPMIFDQDGGRIAGGYLVAREGGGSLSYVGELTYEDMGVFANFAFNALKSLKYQQLTIGMDGEIDGEIITEVKFAGLQQGDTASKNFITRQIARLPIEFNVRIQAPFMQLISSAKSYYEPEILVGQNLPALLRAKEARAKEAVKEIKDNSD